MRRRSGDLVVDQVPMEDVELVVGHGIDELQNGRHWEEVARRVDHHTTIGEPNDDIKIARKR